MGYRLGIDIGTNSIGWWRYDLTPEGKPFRSLGGGVRIFRDGRDPKDKTSFAAKRRLARSMRRRRDRYLRRRTKLLNQLVRFGLLPRADDERKKLVNLDPYTLRAAALDTPLQLHHVGRVIFHLHQRRGFKSNRKTDRVDNEQGIVRQGVASLNVKMEASNARTLGEFLYQRHERSEWVRARKRMVLNVKGKAVEEYDIYPTRRIVEEEFDTIWKAQSTFHSKEMTEQARAAIKNTIFFQRPLRPVDPGRCTFNPDERRLPWADPISQRRRIYEQANQLMIVVPGAQSVALTREQRDLVAGALLNHPKRTFIQLRKLLRLRQDQRFNLESEIRSDLKGDETAALLSKDQHFGTKWREYPLSRQREIVSRLIEEEDEQVLATWLHDECSLDDVRAHATSLVMLPEGYASLGTTATTEILKALENDVVVYSEAAKRAGYNHSDFRTGEILDRLPYYGEWLPQAVMPGTGNSEDADAERYGRIPNPTVHIALGQLRRVVNALIERHGAPEQIVVELARELKASKKQREQYEKNHVANRRRAEMHRDTLAQMGLPDTGDNRVRLRLYDELAPLDHRCPYSGKPITRAMLFSGEVEIDHILPFSVTLDNRIDNRVLVLSEWNRRKGNRTPYEAFGTMDIWPEIALRGESLPAGKRRRFQPDGLEWFKRDGADFLARHLTDTQYISTVAKEYLSAICDPNKIHAIPGGLTALVRGKWRFDDLLGGNLKNRDNHKHHAVDAAVIGLIDRGFLGAVSKAASLAEDRGALDKISIPMPWAGLKEEIKQHLDAIIISHKLEHGGAGQDANRGRVGKFFKDTAYTIVGDTNKLGVPLVAHRVPLSSFESRKDIEAVRDPALRAALLECVADQSGKDFAAAIAKFGKEASLYKGIRRVRIEERISVIPVRDKNGKEYKAYASDGNFSFTIWLDSKGSWVSEIMSLHDAAQGGTSPFRAENPTAKKVMALKQGDMIAVQDRDGRRIMRIVKFSKGSVFLAEHFESGNLKARDADKDDYFKYLSKSATALQKMQARKIRIDAAGRIFDPGPLKSLP